MLDLFVWWFLLLLIGLAAWPLAFHFFAAQPGRGYAFVRVLGLGLWGFSFWLLEMLGLLQNTLGGIALLLVAGAGAVWFALGRKPDAKGVTPAAWLRREWVHVLLVEAVFAVAFLAFAYYRSFNPEISATEKPMEFAFLNGILKSVQFPPRDPWLSGFSISYYYFGYVLVVLLTRLSGIPSAITFNLGLTSIYALAAVGAFGLVYAMVQAMTGGDTRNTAGRRGAYVAATLAVFLLLIVGNLEGFLEVLHSAGWGTPEFWHRIDINNLAGAPVTSSPIPSDAWWWWRASRVVNDHDPRNCPPVEPGHAFDPRDCAHIEVIDEFPAFSFLLGDLHPHVLALPLNLLALAIAFELIASRGSAFAWPWTVATAWRLGVAGILVGALGFTNTTDLPTFAFVVVVAYGLARVSTGRWGREEWLDIGRFTGSLGALSFLLYSPFYLGFKSQVKGFMPVIFFKTPIDQYLVMFGLFVVVLTSFVGLLLWERRRALRQHLAPGLSYLVVILAVPMLLAFAVFLALTISSSLRDQVAAFLQSGPDANVPLQILVAYLQTLWREPWVLLLLALLLAAILMLLREGLGIKSQNGAIPGWEPSVKFALLLTFTGFLLTLGTELVYIRDTFETRMNTVFKLYYQAWTLFAIAAAFAAWYLGSRLGRAGRVAFGVMFASLFALSLVYPLLAYPNRANYFQANEAAGIPTLDGMAYVRNTQADEYAVIDWLNRNAPAASYILEAPGPQYSDYDRISMATGLPTVLGWGGHELQWRGNYDEPGRREPEIQEIYTTLDAARAKALLETYEVRYVIVGPRERSKYGLGVPMIDKFRRVGQLAFTQGQYQVFQVQ